MGPDDGILSSTQPKQEAYVSYAASLSTEKLYQALSTVHDDFFRVKPEDAIADNFKVLGLQYDREEDIDTLALCVATEISRREGNDRVKQTIESRIGRRSLERLIGNGLQSMGTPFEQLRQLAQPMEDLFSTMYDLLQKQPHKEFYIKDEIMRKIGVPLSIDKNIFYKVENTKVWFGLCGNKYEEPNWKEYSWDSRYGYYGFKVEVERVQNKRPWWMEKTENQKEFETRSTIRVCTGQVAWINPVTVSFSTPQQFLKYVEDQISNVKSTKKTFMDNLTTIFAFPSLLNKGMMLYEQQIQRDIQMLLEARQRETEKMIEQ